MEEHGGEYVFLDFLVKKNAATWRECVCVSIY